MNNLKIVFIIILMFYFSTFTLFAEAIKEIIVKGNARVANDYVETLLSAEVGGDYSLPLLNNDLGKLYASELFEKVDGSFIGGVLAISVIENPLIEDINITGNSEIKSDVILKDMLSKRRVTFSQNRLNIDIQRILDIYYKSGYLAASVSYELQKKDFNRLDIAIKIIEGKKTTIKTIKFIGNNNFSKNELENAILTKESKWWRFFNAGDVYDKNRILYDGELLRQFYLENGYPNFAVISNFAELSLDTSFIVTYVIDEGERYKFGDTSLIIKITDMVKYEDVIKAEIDLLRQNEWFRNSSLQRQLIKIKDKIEELGYQFISVEPQMIFNDFSRKVDIVFVLTEEKKLFVNKINFHGNKRTKDYVLRRELTILEKDSYSSDKASNTQRNLYRTGYFSSVTIEDKPSNNAGEVNVDINVEEVLTGSISVGGGFSTTDGLQFEAGYKEANLMGTGNNLSLTLNLSKATQVYDISLADPYFLNRELYGSVSLYRKDTGANTFSNSKLYNNVEQGVAFSIGYRVNNFITHRIGYKYFYRNIKNVHPSSSLSIREIAGKSFVSALNNFISYNSTDNPVFITRGVDHSLYTEFAGIFGNSHYINNTLKSIYYYSLFEDVVFSALGSVGVIEGLKGESVKIIDKYRLGGATLRGFRAGANYGGIGPVDKTTGETIGGKYMFRGSLQIDTPIPGVKQYGLIVHAFSDFGTVTDFSKKPDIIDNAYVRLSAGVGFSWRSPAGIISVDFGLPIRKLEKDVTEVIFLNFGTRV